MSSHRLRSIIEARDPARRDTDIAAACAGMGLGELLDEAADLEDYRRGCDNLYLRVRALFFLYSLHRFQIPARPELPVGGRIPYPGHLHLLKRRFGRAIQTFLAAQQTDGPSDGLSSALAAAYHGLAFATLADQVRNSVRATAGNRWMFRIGHAADHPLRLRPELLQKAGDDRLYPLLRERTAVRMDLSHSAWSDIFFLGMDAPDAAQVLNVSIDLAVHGRDAEPSPPVEACLRVIDEPLLRLTSVDLEASADISSLEEVFDFARDHLGLLKAAVIAAGLIPPGLEGSGQPLEAVLERLCGPGRGLELCSFVHGIPKGSRLAVSTNLLGCLIAVAMRATGQTRSVDGPLHEEDRRQVAARAILGEWLGGSGGGWQDSGGVWPGVKLIRGELAREGDPEYGISRGRLLPVHHLLSAEEASPESLQRLQDSLLLVHGGMAQNVGPVLEMVTEKYLLRSAAEHAARGASLDKMQEILAGLASADIRQVARATHDNFHGPLQAIIPAAENLFTARLIEGARHLYGEGFWGFCMLGGMSGGGMGFFFAPELRDAARGRMLELMQEQKRALEHALPFAMDPVVYDFAINQQGSAAELLQGPEACMPAAYYTLLVPGLLRRGRRNLPRVQRRELDHFAQACREQHDLQWVVPALFDQLFPRSQGEQANQREELQRLLEQHGFDPVLHESIRSELRQGRIGLSQNRLPQHTEIEDVPAGTVRRVAADDTAAIARGRAALQNGEVAVLSLAAGAGSRWTQGAGVVKALNPFCKLGARHRSFCEIHLAKSRARGLEAGCMPAHVFSTSYLTHAPLAAQLEAERGYGFEGPLHLSPGRAVGLRLVPTERDLIFAFTEMPQQMLDAQAQKLREHLHEALIGWAKQSGEASDYRDNVPLQCLHPVGHWFELPNMLRNGTLQKLLTERPQLRYLLLHNIDTLGADLDPALLGAHIDSGAPLSFEVIPRRLEDRGGGLALVNGRVRLLEGLAMPREEDEFKLRYYNTLSTWVDLDQLLALVGISKDQLGDEAVVQAATRRLSQRLPTYITHKEVKKRWGHGQEDVFPVLQFEKLWGDMSALPDLQVQYLEVSRSRGQQLKDPVQLDGWLRDGSAAQVAGLSAFPDA